MKTKSSGLLILFFNLYLISCVDYTRQNSHIASIEPYKTQESETLKKDQAIYLKSFDVRHYPPKGISTSEIKKTEHAIVQQRHISLADSDINDTRFHQFSLDNGLQVFLLVRDDLPMVSISAVVDAGKHQLKDEDELLSPLVLKLLKQGTTNYPKFEFQKRAALLGESIKYRQTSQYSVISAEILPQDMELALELLSQQLAYISPADNAREKIIERQLLENKLSQSSGFYLAKLLFYQNNYPHDHFYSYQLPSSSQIKAVTNKQLMNFYHNQYNPENSKLIIVGDIDVKQIRLQIKKQFSDWKIITENQIRNRDVKPSAKHETNKNTAIKNVSRIDLINRKGAQQANILYGVVTEPGYSEDWMGLKIIASILGGGPGSRLFADLREKQGLAYSISANQLAGRHDSPFFIQTSVAHDKVVQTIDGIKKHLDYLCHYKVDKRELSQIKQQLTGEIAFDFQTNHQWVNDKIHQLEMRLEDDYITDMILQINRMTSEQLLRIAKQYLCTEHNFIIVGEKKLLEQALLKQFHGYRYESHKFTLQQ